MMERGKMLGRLDALRFILNLDGEKEYVEALDDAIALLDQKEGGNTMDMNTQRDEGTQKNEKRENARADVLEDIEAAIKGLKDVQRYGMFVQKEAECERKLSEGIRLLRAMKEVSQG